jgi:hypothetical protein
MGTYLLIGLVLGLLRAVHICAGYLRDWYRWRGTLNFRASVDEFVGLLVFSEFIAVLIMFAWPLWIWHKFSEYRQETR